MKKISTLTSICTLACLALAPAAPAATESEPNDDVAHASGPLTGGSSHSGDFVSAADRDWFVLYTNPSRQLDLAVTKTEGSACSSTVDARLLDADGRKVASKTVTTGETDNIRQLTAPGPARYYLLLATDCPPGTAGDPYEIAALDNGTIAASSPAEASRPRPDAAPVPEPNDDISHAFGPLAGATQYSGTTDSPADEDWFVLYTHPGQQLDIALTKVGTGCSSTIDARLLDADGRGVQGSAVSNNETDHFRLATPAAPGRFYVQVFDTCAGDAYQLRADPVAAIDLGSPLLGSQPRPPDAIIREPNDRFARAFGPLLGGVVYGGDFRSATDVDHMLLYTKGPGPVDLVITKAGRGCSSSIEARLFDPSGVQLQTGGPASNQVWHMAFRARRATGYVLRTFSGCHGDPYQVRVDSPNGVRRSAPALLSVQRRARRSYVAAGSLLGKLGLRRAHACAGGRALLTVRAGRKRIAARRARVRRDCSYSTRLALRPRRRMKFAVRFKGRKAFANLRGRRTVTAP
jgi:hypothetical protein